ncbi:YycH family regulatory protein [Alteribacillus sp. HJP-4]|uniref:YycH family regulatory protein n=1 Tax=Alteribacillus sp. HJP-4 TaxID=2775394 RepID=UPI0035CD137B
MIERIKSWVLTILITSSVILTWQIWTFQPNYDHLTPSNYVESEPFADSQSLSDVIWPDQIVFHDGLQQAAINGNDEEFRMFFEGLLDSRFEEMTPEQSLESEELFNGPRTAEIIFPADVPGEVLQSMLNFESDAPDFAEDESIDRMFIIDEGDDNESLKVQFITDSGLVLMEGTTDFSRSELRDSYFSRITEFSSVFSYYPDEDEGLSDTIYLPEDTTTQNIISDTSSEISHENFLQFLFNDHESVRPYNQDSGEATYTDGNRMMSLEYGGNYLSYVNPVYSENPSDTQNHVVLSTFDYVNSHGGWTDTYQLYDWNRESREETATFRMLVSGLPVFESSGRDLASIDVSRSGGQISQYSRPLFDFDDSPINTGGSKTLASGSEVVSYIEDQFESENVENIRIGYQMEETDNLLYQFEPSWFVKYEDSWYPISVNEESSSGEG